MRVFSGSSVQCKWWWWGSGVQLSTEKRCRPWWLQISLLVANFFWSYAFLCRHLCRLNDDRSFLFLFLFLSMSKANETGEKCVCVHLFLRCSIFFSSYFVFAGVYMKRRPKKTGQAHAIGDANWDREDWGDSAVTIRSDDRLVGKHRDWQRQGERKDRHLK